MINEIAFATIGKDGKDDHSLSVGGQDDPSREPVEIAFATIGKDGKDDCGKLSLGSAGESPSDQAPEIAL